MFSLACSTITRHSLTDFCGRLRLNERQARARALQLRRFVRRFGVTRLAGNRPGFSLSRAPASKLEEVALAWRWCQENSEGPVSGRAGSNRAGVRLAATE
jgi:hypothetical protein